MYKIKRNGDDQVERLYADPCAYFKRFGNNDFVILLLYVDDMLVACPNKDRISKLKAQLAREFKMKDLGPANKILGMQIHRDRVSRKIWLSQKSYVKKILQRFNMQDCKPISTPFATNIKLSSKMSPSSEKERMEMSRVPYASAVGSLMFAMICTRPDIAHAVGVVSRYMAEPGREHWEAVKRILRYIKGTSDVALCYGESGLTVKGYVDSDYAGDLDGSKSTTGYVFTLSGGTVSWVSKLQSVVAMSTTEAEYVAAAQASKEAVWLKMLLEELGHEQEKITLFCDNQSALYLARNPAFHSKTKHIRVQYHFVREKVEEGTVDMQKIHTDDNMADYMTKAINCDKFICCRSSCGLAET
ncbi:retrovirus-related pol polyprotein from transposon TNT 1-94 [Tanacetum coccineum]